MPQRRNPLSRSASLSRQPFRSRSRAIRAVSERRETLRAALAVLPASNSKTTRRALWHRSDGLCEACGWEITEHGFQAHHRKMRSQGGNNSLANLIAVHPICHRRIHDNPDDSYRRGLLVHGWDNPVRVRARLFDEERSA